GPLERLRMPRPTRSAGHAVQAIGLGIAALGLVLAAGATALALLGASALLLLALRRAREPQALPVPLAGGARWPPPSSPGQAAGLNGRRRSPRGAGPGGAAAARSAPPRRSR